MRSKRRAVQNQEITLTKKCVCEGLSNISINFTLHLIKVRELKRLFKKVSSDLKTILKTDLTYLPFNTIGFFEL